MPRNPYPLPIGRHALSSLLRRLTHRAGPAEEWEAPHLERPLACWPSVKPTRQIVYCTKLRPFLNTSPLAVGLLGQRRVFIERYGLFHPSLSPYVLAQASPGSSVLFIGDLDPLDLLAYLTLQSELAQHKVPVKYLGIADPWLRQLAKWARKKLLPAIERFLIPLNPFELDCLAALQSTGLDWQSILGPASLALLQSGRKIELEATTLLDTPRRSILKAMLPKAPQAHPPPTHHPDPHPPRRIVHPSRR